MILSGKRRVAKTLPWKAAEGQEGREDHGGVLVLRRGDLTVVLDGRVPSLGQESSSPSMTCVYGPRGQKAGKRDWREKKCSYSLSWAVSHRGAAHRTTVSSQFTSWIWDSIVCVADSVGLPSHVG